MGQAVAKYATSVGFSHVIAIDVKDSLAQALKGASVVIDFSSNEGTRALAEVAKKKRIPLVIGTTGIEPETRKLLEAAARVSPVFIATNMSYGVYVLGMWKLWRFTTNSRSTRQAAPRLRSRRNFAHHNFVL